jgi:hypothetical protein
MNNYLYGIFGSILLVLGVLLLVFPIMALGDPGYRYGGGWTGVLIVFVPGAVMLWRYYRHR